MNRDLAPLGPPVRPDRHEPGWHGIAVAICLQAMSDYYHAMRANLIREMTVAPEGDPLALTKGGMRLNRAEAVQLISFIRDGDMESLLDLCGFTVPSSRLETLMLEMERTGTWKKHFNQGVRRRSSLRKPGKGRLTAAERRARMQECPEKAPRGA